MGHTKGRTDHEQKQRMKTRDALLTAAANDPGNIAHALLNYLRYDTRTVPDKHHSFIVFDRRPR